MSKRQEREEEEEAAECQLQCPTMMALLTGEVSSD